VFRHNHKEICYFTHSTVIATRNGAAEITSETKSIVLILTSGNGFSHVYQISLLWESGRLLANPACHVRRHRTIWTGQRLIPINFQDNMCFTISFVPGGRIVARIYFGRSCVAAGLGTYMDQAAAAADDWDHTRSLDILAGMDRWQLDELKRNLPNLKIMDYQWDIYETNSIGRVLLKLRITLN